jgi:copper transport protein
LIAIAALVLGPAPSASAHATLVRSEPADNAVVPTAPGRILLWFGEPVSPEFTDAEVVDLEGREVRLPGPPTLLGTSLLAAPLPSLPNGVYSVEWRALSPGDGHATTGSLVFRVGAGGPSPGRRAGEAPSAAESAEAPEVALRWLNVSLLMAVVGGLAVSILVLDPKRGRRMPSVHPGVLAIRRGALRRVLRWTHVSCWLAVGAGAALLGWQAGSLGRTLPDPGFADAVRALATRTRWGEIWLVREGLLVAAAWSIGLLRRQPDDRWNTGRAALLVLGATVAQAFSSHAAALPNNTTIAVAAHAVHLLAAGVWVGGLAALAVGLLPMIRRHRVELASIARTCLGTFSRVAAVSVGILAATGLYSAGREVVSVHAGATTLYGRTLVAKSVLLLGAGGLGLLNSALLHPRLAASVARLLRRPAGWTPVSMKRLPSLVIAEVAVGVVATMAVGVLTSAPPARTPRPSAFEPTPVRITRAVDDLLVTFGAQPNRPGENLFTVSVASTRRPPLALVRGVTLRLEGSRDTGRATNLTMREDEPGSFRAGGDFLDRPGNWSVQVLITRGGKADRTTSFDWSVSPLGPNTRPGSDRPLGPPLTVAAGVVLAITLVGAGASSLRRKRGGIAPSAGRRAGARPDRARIQAATDEPRMVAERVP